MDAVQLGPSPPPQTFRLALFAASNSQRRCVLLADRVLLARCGLEDGTSPRDPRRNQSLAGTWFAHLTDAGRDLLGSLRPWAA
jgi:hypothetical protein